MKIFQKISVILAALLLITVGYLYYRNVLTKNEQKTSTIVPLLNRPEYSSNYVDDSATTNTGDGSQTTTTNTGTSGQTTINSSQVVSGYTLKIDGANISAPLLLNIEGNDQEQYLKALEKGVAHMARTAQPGDAGNTVIFGHSSYYINKPGSYKTIFATLDKLKNGDLIQITSSSKALNFSVTGTKIVEPDDTSVVMQDSSKHLLTLITCWPPKTTDKRYVVVAELTR